MSERGEMREPLEEKRRKGINFAGGQTGGKRHGDRTKRYKGI